jgi:hypothetical protein
VIVSGGPDQVAGARVDGPPDDSGPPARRDPIVAMAAAGPGDGS